MNFYDIEFIFHNIYQNITDFSWDSPIRWYIICDVVITLLFFFVKFSFKVYIIIIILQ